MGIHIFGRWLFGKPDYVKKMEEIEELRAEINDIKLMIDQETVRFRRELNQISDELQIRFDEIVEKYEQEIDQIDWDESSVLREAEITLSLSYIDSKLAASARDGLQRLAKAKRAHDAAITRLIERRDDCYLRLCKLVDDYRTRYGGLVNF